MEIKAVQLSELDLKMIEKESESKIVLFHDITTKSISCSRCKASANNSNEIKHRDCCPYIWGGGC